MPTANTTVGAILVPSNAEGDVTVRFDLIDPEAENVSIQFEVSVDNGTTWRAGTVKDDSRLTGLSTSSTGVSHHVVWDSLADLGFRRESGSLLRITPTDSVGPGTPGYSSVPTIDNLATASKKVENYMIHYGAFDAAALALAKSHQLVVAHVYAGNLTRETIREIQNGVDPADPSDDVIVLAYISVGEDLRTTSLTDAQMLADPRFTGDGTGPRIDPRGPNADGQSLTSINPLGLPSNGGTGYASWYLDDNSVDNNGGTGDGKPDRNSNFGGAFVNAGDPKWFTALDAMTLDGVDGIPGMRELLTLDYGRGLGCDGLFLDAIDTCAPNSFTDGSSVNQSEFEWTAPGFATFIPTLEQTYPKKLVMQNRGLFFFDPRQPHYAVCTRADIDYLKFESYRLNSNTFEEYDTYFFPDNKYNITPKLMAEANRPDGFRVFSVGYAEGPGIEHDTLLGTASGGFATLVEDIRQAQELAGFRHYITDATVAFPNSFVRDHTDMTDTTPPAWTSTYNVSPPFPTPTGAPTPRVGIQQVVAGYAAATVRWDVALDLNRVGYALYYSKTPFDFVGDPDLTTATRVALTPTIGSGYAAGVGPSAYPYEAAITGLSELSLYYFCIRAFDSAGNEDTNQVVLSTTTRPGFVTVTIDGLFGDWNGVSVTHTDPADVADSSGPDWRDIRIVNDASNLYIRFGSDNAFNLDGSPGFGYSRYLIFCDTDANPATGYSYGAVGSELLVTGVSLYSEAAGVFNNGYLQDISINPTTSVVDCELSMPLSRIYAATSGAKTIRLVFVNDEVNDVAPDTGYIEYTISK